MRKALLHSYWLVSNAFNIHLLAACEIERTMASHQVPNFNIVVQDLAPRVEQVWQRINCIAPDILSSNIYVKAYARDCLNQLHLKSAMTPSLIYQLACFDFKWTDRFPYVSGH